MCTKDDVKLIEYIKSLSRKNVMVNIDNAWLNRNDMECLFHDDMQLIGEVSTSIYLIYTEVYLYTYPIIYSKV